MTKVIFKKVLAVMLRALDQYLFGIPFLGITS